MSIQSISIEFIFALFLLSSCRTQNLMNYYYPTKESFTKVYKYTNPENNELDEYWIVSYNSKEGVISTKSHRHNYKLYNQFEEQISSRGAQLIGYIDYDEKQGVTAAKLKKDDVYLLDKSNEYSYMVEYSNQWGKFTFEKKRKFIGFETIIVNAKNYETAKFKDHYIIKAIDQNDEYEYVQFSYYSNKIGMLRYERMIPNEGTRILQLEEILTLGQFEKLKKASR